MSGHSVPAGSAHQKANMIISTSGDFNFQGPKTYTVKLMSQSGVNNTVYKHAYQKVYEVIVHTALVGTHGHMPSTLYTN